MNTITTARRSARGTIRVALPDGGVRNVSGVAARAPYLVVEQYGYQRVTVRPFYDRSLAERVVADMIAHPVVTRRADGTPGLTLRFALLVEVV